MRVLRESIVRPFISWHHVLALERALMRPLLSWTGAPGRTQVALRQRDQVISNQVFEKQPKGLVPGVLWRTYSLSETACQAEHNSLWVPWHS